MNRNWTIEGIAATTVIVLTIPMSLVLHHISSEVAESKAEFVGGNACIDCHRSEYDSWKESDHALAMTVASDSTVLGDFNNAEFRSQGVVTRFFRRNGKFFVNTAGPGGKQGDFEITHTFGVRPLQQYLVPFDGGKYQCLPIAWDAVSKKWFDLSAMVYPNEKVTPTNWLYWTNQAQNWNGMCAECHSTYLRKNFDLSTKTFATTWSDINVNCEACHGPGSKHIEWANLPEMARSTDTQAGLVLRTSGITSRQLVELCAPCHSRRSSLGVNDHMMSSYFDNNIPSLITEPNYFIDGQIREEDYVYGSFLQSKMYMKDVRCTDCHDSHTLRIKYKGNALCAQCHRESEYDTPAHHFHKYAWEKGKPALRKSGEKVAVGEGALCVNCHMPGRYYMGIDYRRDHSFRIPRPDLTVTLGTPNACNDCHGDKDAQWSQKQIVKWYGEKKKPHYATALHAGALILPGADSSLVSIIGSDLYPEIIRATAVQYLAAYRSGTARSAVRKALHDDESVVRLAAVAAFVPDSPGDLMKAIAPALDDPTLAVRIEAAGKLAELTKDQFSDIQYQAFKSALRERLASLGYAGDFPAGRFNLGNFYEKRNDPIQAARNYSEAIAIDSIFYPAKVNLALLSYNAGNIARAEELLLDLKKNHKEFIEGPFYLGLLYAEQKKFPEAIENLRMALSTMKDNERVYYNLGLLYQYEHDVDRSENYLMEGYRKFPDSEDIIFALANLYVQKGEFDRAKDFAEELQKKFPSNPAANQILDYLNTLHRESGGGTNRGNDQ